MIMTTKPVRWFFYSAGIVLLVTACAKLGSSMGRATFLEMPDPLTLINFRWLFRIVGLLEVVVGLLCLFNIRDLGKACAVASVATTFTAYRMNLMWLGYHRPCHCLGNLTDALNISPKAADTGMKVILGYLLLGSYATLFWLWKRSLRSSIARPTSSGAGKSAS